MLNIVVPMAGRGSRFTDAGYTVPKPAIPIRGMPMVELVARSLRPARAHRFTFLVLKDHVDRFGFDRLLHGIDPSARIVTVDTVTEGAACTVLLARDAIDSDDPLMLANSDQWVDMNINEYLATLDGGGADGLIMTMTADDPKWSYVGLDSRGRVVASRSRQLRGMATATDGEDTVLEVSEGRDCLHRGAVAVESGKGLLALAAIRAGAGCESSGRQRHGRRDDPECNVEFGRHAAAP